MSNQIEAVKLLLSFHKRVLFKRSRSDSSKLMGESLTHGLMIVCGHVKGNHTRHGEGRVGILGLNECSLQDEHGQNGIGSKACHP